MFARLQPLIERAELVGCSGPPGNSGGVDLDDANASLQSQQRLYEFVSWGKNGACRGDQAHPLQYPALANPADVTGGDWFVPMSDSINPGAASERHLVQRMLAGEQAAFESFFSAHAGRLASFAARRSALDAAALEDVVQQTMIKAVRNLDGFRGESTLHTWLCQICRNVLADIRRKAGRQPRVDSLEATMEKSAALPVQLIDYRDPLDDCADDSTRAAIRQMINALPPALQPGAGTEVWRRIAH